jgi:hypothetical protein
MTDTTHTDLEIPTRIIHPPKLLVPVYWTVELHGWGGSLLEVGIGYP